MKTDDEVVVDVVIDNVGFQRHSFMIPGEPREVEIVCRIEIPDVWNVWWNWE